MSEHDTPEPGTSRRPKNAAEGAFWDLATDHGYYVSKRGWPDFLIEKDGGIMAVEVKPEGGRSLRRDQLRVLTALSAFGVPCYLWSPTFGFERIQSAEAVGGRGEDVSSKERQQINDQATNPQPALEGCGEPFESPAPDDKRGKEIDRVWDFYVEVMKPRRKAAGSDDRAVIRNALKVASAEELCRAIAGCRASSFHMGVNDRQRKYNKLSQVMRGRRGRETTRERIDFFLDITDAGAKGGSFPSADPGVIQQKKLVVQRGWRFREFDPVAVQEAEEAEKWLREHGIETHRRALDGYPMFRALRGPATT